MQAWAPVSIGQGTAEGNSYLTRENKSNGCTWFDSYLNSRCPTRYHDVPIQGTQNKSHCNNNLPLMHTHGPGCVVWQNNFCNNRDMTTYDTSLSTKKCGQTSWNFNVLCKRDFARKQSIAWPMFVVHNVYLTFCSTIRWTFCIRQKTTQAQASLTPRSHSPFQGRW